MAYSKYNKPIPKVAILNFLSSLKNKYSITKLGKIGRKKVDGEIFV